MQGATSKRLTENKSKIMSAWAERATREVDSARRLGRRTLANSLPLFLDHLGEALATNRKIDFGSVTRRDEESAETGKSHGADRARSSEYVLTEVISEYHILRQVIFEFLEDKEQLSKIERDIIFDAMEQSVNNAAVEFTEIHSDIQEKFVSTLTHDLRNPLSAVKMGADLIRIQANNPETCTKFGGLIIANVNRIDSMIQDLLDASKLRAGAALTFEITECKLDSVIREVADEMSLIHGDRFTLHSDTEVTGYLGCSGIRRMIENLIGNASKYSTPETPITVSLKKLNQAVQIIIHNVGNPIPEKDQPILFQQYRRAKSAEESAKTGWGLGLTLVKGVVDAHKGSVRVESTKESGTSFIVELPCPAQPPRELNSNGQSPIAVP